MRIRLALAAVLVKFARVLLSRASFLTARLPEVAPVVHTSATDAPTFDELASQIHRFTSERAPVFPGEGVQLALFIAAFAESVAPALARFRAAVAPAPPPELPSKDDAVN
jgi:hypothetical protein